MHSRDAWRPGHAPQVSPKGSGAPRRRCPLMRRADGRACGARPDGSHEAAGGPLVIGSRAPLGAPLRFFRPPTAFRRQALTPAPSADRFPRPTVVSGWLGPAAARESRPVSPFSQDRTSLRRTHHRSTPPVSKVKERYPSWKNKSRTKSPSHQASLRLRQPGRTMTGVTRNWCGP
jgi:hypothetical protein